MNNSKRKKQKSKNYNEALENKEVHSKKKRRKVKLEILNSDFRRYEAIQLLNSEQKNKKLELRYNLLLVKAKGVVSYKNRKLSHKTEELRNFMIQEYMKPKPDHKEEKSVKYSKFQGGGKNQADTFADHRTYAEWLHPESLEDRATEYLKLIVKQEQSKAY